MSKSTRSTSKRKPATPSGGSGETTTFVEEIKVTMDSLMVKVKDETPLPANFRRELLVELYVARSILFAAFTLGLRLGGLSLFYTPLRVFGSLVILPVTYLVLPLFGLTLVSLYINKKVDLNIHELRCLLIGWALLCGVFSTAANIHYSLTDAGAPSYFMPILVGIMISAMGNSFDSNRKHFVAIAIAPSALVAVTLLLLTDRFGMVSLFVVVLSTINAVIALQLMVFDVKHDASKIRAEAVHVTGIIFNMILYLITFRLFGTYIDNPSANNIHNAVPIQTAFFG